MNIIQESSQLLLAHDICQQWPELRGAIERSIPREPFSWKLPAVAAEAVGGQPRDVLPALAGFSCVHISIRLIDDLLDEDQRLESVDGDLARTANLAIAFQALGVDFLLGLEDPLATASLKELGKMQLYLAWGQDLDAQNIQNEERYWQIAKAKSGIYFASALYVGALYGDAHQSVAEQLRDFGVVYGEIMQIHDDLNDTLEDEAGPDWLGGRHPLPILFAETVDHPDRDRFLELRQRITDPAALREAQEILVRSGAISYAVNELILRHEIAQSKLDAITLPNPQPIQLLLDELMEPVENLLEQVAA